MSGKFTHLKYDQDAYNDSLSSSVNPMLYKLDPNYAVNYNRCFFPNGPRNGHDAAVSRPEDRIDVDSILRGLGKKSSKSISGQTPKSLNNFRTEIPPECESKMESVYSRYTHPAREIKGLHVDDMRFDYPLHDPQCHIFENFQVNTRLQAKDNHRTTWQIPIDQSTLYPSDHMGKLKNCTSTSRCEYGPFIR